MKIIRLPVMLQTAAVAHAGQGKQFLFQSNQKLILLQFIINFIHADAGTHRYKIYTSSKFLIRQTIFPKQMADIRNS